MTELEFNRLREQFNDECTQALGLKGKEYSGVGDRLGNFKRLATALGLSPEKICLVYMVKHIEAIHSFVRDGKVYSEPIRGRLMDARNYIDLLLALIEDKDA